MWTLLLTLILIGCVLHLCLKAYKYEPISRFHHFFVPVYSIILFLITMRWNSEDLKIFVFLLIASLVTGWFETLGIDIRKRKDAKTGRIRYCIKRGTPFVIGWAVLLAAGISMSETMGHEGVVTLFEDRIFENIFEELDPLAIFTSAHPWYIWLMSGVSSLTFISAAWSKIRRREDQGLLLTEEDEKR